MRFITKIFPLRDFDFTFDHESRHFIVTLMSFITKIYSLRDFDFITDSLTFASFEDLRV